jgi:hypothetical protein
MSDSNDQAGTRESPPLEAQSLEVEGTSGTGPLVVTAVLFVFGVVMLAMIGTETSPPPSSKGWWTAPSLAPASALVFLVLMSGAALITQLRRTWIHPLSKPGRDWLLAVLREGPTLVEFGLYFILYVWLIDKIGYALSTLCFVQISCWRAGRRGWRSLLFTIVFTGVLVILFRVILKVWIPAAPIYEWLPDNLRNLAIVYL